MTFRKPALFICCLFVIGAGGIRTLVALPVRGVTPWEQMAAVDGQGITVDSGGTLVHRPGLFYRWEAAQQQVDGTVIAELVVDERGDVIDARILSGPDAFRRTVLQSVLQWQYSPDGSGNRRIQARIDFLHPPTTAATPPPAPSRGTSSDSGFNLRINVEPPNQTLPTESEPLSSSEVTVAPKLVNKVDPLYSAEARRVRYQGTVVLEAIVRTDGSVQITRIVRSLDGNFGEMCRRGVAAGKMIGLYNSEAECPETLGLDQNARSALEQWRFLPATKDGVPVPVRLNIEVNFNLK